MKKTARTLLIISAIYSFTTFLASFCFVTFFIPSFFLSIILYGFSSIFIVFVSFVLNQLIFGLVTAIMSLKSLDNKTNTIYKFDIIFGIISLNVFAIIGGALGLRFFEKELCRSHSCTCSENLK